MAGFKIADNARLNGTITPIASSYFRKDNVHTFYKFGLASAPGVGWDAFKLAFRSYNDPDFVPRYTYGGTPDRQHMNARDLFDRVAQFSEIAERTGDPYDALRTLPDRGQLLDRHFPVFKTPNTRTQAELGPPHWTSPALQQQHHQQQRQQQAQQRQQQAQQQMGR